MKNKNFNWNQRQFMLGNPKGFLNRQSKLENIDSGLTTAQIAELNAQAYSNLVKELSKHLPDSYGGLGLRTSATMRDDFYKPENMRRGKI